MTRKHLLAVTAVVALAVSAGVVAKQQTVILKDGRRLTGDVVKSEDGYEIRTPAGTVVIATGDVLRVEEAVTPKVEFQRRLDRTNKNDADAIYRLASWARENGLLAEARDLLKKVRTLRPDHEGAKLLLRLVEISLSASKTTATGPRTTPGEGRLDASKLLKTEDIYRMRLLELKGGDRVSIQFRDKVLDRFIEAMKGEDMFSESGGERRFRRWSRVRQAMYILHNTDRAETQFRGDVLVKTDPEVFRTFRSRVWPIVREGCARPSCHGGAKGAGRLRLFGMPSTDDRVVYTNFYILHAWQRGGRKLINRDQVKNSMLLQAGLPGNIARQNLTHPTELTPPVFASERERNFRLIEGWIESLKRPFLPPGYGVKYRVPGLQEQAPVTTAPAPQE